MKPRTPQLSLRLDAARPAADAHWGAGTIVSCLGRQLRLVLDTTCAAPERHCDELHLPLPPAATARQVRDAAESWLRDEAVRSFAALAKKQGCRVVLSYGRCGDWAKREGQILRCHWRLVEQSPAIIEQILNKALAAPAARADCPDMFAVA